MTPTPTPTQTSAPAADPEARLHLGGSTTPNRYDGTWQPLTRDLVAELPALIAALREHGIPVARVAYHIDSWDAAPRRLTVDGQRIRLGGFRYIDPDQLSTVDLYQTVRMTLEVIPPDVPVREAVHHTGSGVEALPRWESDGGPVELDAAVR